MPFFAGLRGRAGVFARPPDLSLERFRRLQAERERLRNWQRSTRHDPAPDQARPSIESPVNPEQEEPTP